MGHCESGENGREADDNALQCFSVAKVARLLGVSRMTVYRLMDQGELPWLQLGGRRVIPAAAIRKRVADAIASTAPAEAG